ncbi:MAG TPA: MBL fold metallo-hydrolase, partial [Arenibaculum sp.]|nr:MBL fold metallo-hydrolase [Arenibaculum sp.]
PPPHRDHTRAARPLQTLTGAPVVSAGPHRAARSLHAGETARMENLPFRVGGYPYRQALCRRQERVPGAMALIFDRDFDPRHGDAVEIVPGVRRVTAPNSGPFTFRGTNTYLVGDRDLVVIDPGPDDAAHLRALRDAIGGARVSTILVTHTHRDHTLAARPLQALSGAPIASAGPHRAARPLHTGETARMEAGGDSAFVPDQIVAHGGVLEAGGFRLEAIATPGHTANHLAFALGGTDLLFSGDHVMGWSTTVVAPPDGSMRDYMSSLEVLLARPERRFLPGHGGMIADADDYVRALREHRLLRERAIVAAVAAGLHKVPDIVAAVYPGLDDALRVAAGMSALAHLEDLVDRGVVRADRPGIDGTYSVAGSAATSAPDSPGSTSPPPERS